MASTSTRATSISPKAVQTLQEVDENFLTILFEGALDAVLHAN